VSRDVFRNGFNTVAEEVAYEWQRRRNMIYCSDLKFAA